MSISVSQLKINPAQAIRDASDAPIAIQKRNKTEAYLVGKDLFDAIVSYIEDFIDRTAVKQSDFSKGREFESVARELGL